MNRERLPVCNHLVIVLIQHIWSVASLTWFACLQHRHHSRVNSPWIALTIRIHLLTILTQKIIGFIANKSKMLFEFNSVSSEDLWNAANARKQRYYAIEDWKPNITTKNTENWIQDILTLDDRQSCAGTHPLHIHPNASHESTLFLSVLLIGYHLSLDLFTRCTVSPNTTLFNTYITFVFVLLLISISLISALILIKWLYIGLNAWSLHQSVDWKPVFSGSIERQLFDQRSDEFVL